MIIKVRSIIIIAASILLALSIDDFIYKVAALIPSILVIIGDYIIQCVSRETNEING
jgi:hypothetical protein